MLHAFLLVTFTAVAVASPSPNIASEMVQGCEDTGQFVTDPQLAAKLANITTIVQRFQDKSKLPQKNFTIAEVKRQDGLQGRRLYITIDNYVYDMQDFAEYHPAGPKPLQNHAGQDATAAVKASGMPPQLYQPFLKYFRVGVIIDSEKDHTSAADAVMGSINSRLT